MKWVYSDGGRGKYFKAEKVGDCVCRAIANATGKDYKEIYNGLAAMMKEIRKRGDKRRTPRDGIAGATARKYITEVLGWKWNPVMKIGTGCKMHLREDELPGGTIIVSLSGHYSCVKDGVLYDTYDCTRGGTRCVYGYYYK